MNFSLIRCIITVVMVAFLGSCTDINTADEGAGPPNIIFILVDDLGWGDVGYHGSKIRTPNIDNLAAGGTRLERSYVFPVCSPTRAALLSGKNPLKFGIDGPMAHDEVLPLGIKLLPQWLNEAGYQTWMVGKWHLGLRSPEAMPNARGFEHFYGLLGGFHDYYTHVFYDGLDWQRNGKSVREEGHSTDLLTQEALSLIETRDLDVPFFLYLAYNAPHTPLQTIIGSSDDFPEITDPDRRVYAQMVADLDEKVGVVLDRLERENLLESTLIVFASDNGGALHLGSRNTPLKGYKSSAFEGGMRTPAIVSWASRLSAGRSVSEPIFVQDWTPTLLAVAGIDFDPTEFDGVNAWSVVSKGEKQKPRTVVMGGVGSLAVYEWPLKYVEHTPRGENMMRVSLFDVVVDPEEMQNLTVTKPEVVKRLARQIKTYQGTRSLSFKGDIPASLFVDKNGRLDYNIRTPETGGPWAERARPEDTSFVSP